MYSEAYKRKERATVTEETYSWRIEVETEDRDGEGANKRPSETIKGIPYYGTKRDFEVEKARILDLCLAEELGSKLHVKVERNPDRYYVIGRWSVKTVRLFLKPGDVAEALALEVNLGYS